jgi:deferrochelatase/peroxidase EfeB
VSGSEHQLSRRAALKGAGLAAAAAVAAATGTAAATDLRQPFHGVHQAGVATPVQDHLAFATFDVAATGRVELASLLAAWAAAAERMAAGEPVAPARNDYYPPSDTGETADLATSSLTLTFGVGAGIFDARFGLASRRPSALVDLPAFPGDRLDPARSGGDLCVQACANDPVVAFHAVRNLARVGLGAVTLRHIQFGSGRASANTAGGTPRNLLGFKDGTSNVRTESSEEMDRYVWVGAETDQPWMVGGTYMVARRIRVHLEEWSDLSLLDQQRAIGRFRRSGAPLTGRRESDPLELAQVDQFGAPVIPSAAHVRVASAETNGGVRLLRRGFNFADGVDPRTGELDAGLMFICFQKDPRDQFVRIQQRLASSDALSRYVVHTASALFAVAPGAAPGEPVAATLLA